ADEGGGRRPVTPRAAWQKIAGPPAAISLVAPSLRLRRWATHAFANRRKTLTWYLSPVPLHAPGKAVCRPGLRAMEGLVYNAGGKAVGSVQEQTLMKVLRPEEVTEFPEFRELTPEELKEAYRLGREAFTAADLQKYTELDEGIPVDEVLAELEEAQRQFDQKAQ